VREHVQAPGEKHVRLRPGTVDAGFRLGQVIEVGGVAQRRLELRVHREPGQEHREPAPRHAAGEQVAEVDAAGQQVVLDRLAVFPEGLYEACDSPGLSSPVSSTGAWIAVIIAPTVGLHASSRRPSSGETISASADR
jgi:hypothetical protein